MSERRYQKKLTSRESIERSLEENGDEDDVIDFSANEHIVDMVHSVDRWAKALTGRSPERIEKETGISRDRMFPEGKKILYVGDPWQRMGREIDDPNMVIIDYEFGETASFIRDRNKFQDQLLGGGGIEGKAQKLLSDLKFFESGIIKTKGREWCQQFQSLVETACNESEQAFEHGLAGFEGAAKAWTEARSFLEEAHRAEQEERGRDAGDIEDEMDDFSQFRVDAWYTLVYAERGFRDIPDWEQRVFPAVKKRMEELEAKNVSDDEFEKQLSIYEKQCIDALRRRKKTEHSHVVQAVFPDLPFQDKTFDRFVASWSISAHLFAHLEESEFGVVWKEIDRVLALHGEAYIFPMHYSGADIHFVDKTVRAYADAHDLEVEYLNIHGEVTEELDQAETLHLIKG